MEKVVLAQIAYRANGDWIEWKTLQGKRLLNWEELQMYLRNAWTAGSETVAIQVRKDELIPEVHPVGA
ncbi:MAG: hypothetical protein ABI700_05105 [Chloroflexota bacterium]